MSGAWVYILKCSDGSYYTGLTRNELPEAREQQHNGATFPDAYTSSRRPVKMVYAEYLDRVMDAIDAERKIKGWSRAKKEALIAGDWALVQILAKRRGGKLKVSTCGACFEARKSSHLSMRGVGWSHFSPHPEVHRPLAMPRRVRRTHIF